MSHQPRVSIDNDKTNGPAIFIKVAVIDSADAPVWRDEFEIVHLHDASNHFDFQKLIVNSASANYERRQT